MRCVAALLAIGTLVGCDDSSARRPIDGRLEDRFERAALGSSYRNTGGPYEIVRGELRVKGARNHPLWLRRRLPRDVTIEFDVRSVSPDGDIKVEVFGDGKSFATEDSYTATSYVVIFGGWRNTLNVLARMDEHGDDRKVRRGPRVERGRSYHFRIDREGGLLRWAVDGQPMLEWNDGHPLEGAGHEFFAFNNWDSELYFDNLVIQPAGRDGR